MSRSGRRNLRCYLRYRSDRLEIRPATAGASLETFNHKRDPFGGLVHRDGGWLEGDDGQRVLAGLDAVFRVFGDETAAAHRVEELA